MGTAVLESESERLSTWAEERVSQVMGVVNAATAELVSVLAEVLRTEAWAVDGIRSPEHWVAWRCGVSASRARALVAMARRLGSLPEVAAAFTAGALTEDSVKVVVARTPPERDGEVADLAAVMTVSQLTRTLRSLPAPEDAPEDVGSDTGTGTDTVDLFCHDGGLSLRAELVPERAMVVRKALEAARDAVFRAAHPDADDNARPAGVTWADALERMAIAALESLDPAGGTGRPASERYQVIVHVERSALGGGLVAHPHLGPALSAAARRRLTCDSDLRWVLEDEGRPLAWGRRVRTIPAVLRALIEDRDRACRFPGCAQARWLEVHHLVHVEDGGETLPENLACLCPRHHAEHHQGRIAITGDPTRPDGLAFTDHRGRPIHAPPATPPDGAPAEAARTLGLRTAPYVPATGERFDGRWFAWN